MFKSNFSSINTTITKIFKGILFCNMTFYKILKNKLVGEYDVDPYFATILNCSFWLIYGLPFVHPDSILVLITNSIGIAL